MHCRYNGDHEVRNEETDSPDESYQHSAEQRSPNSEPLSQVMQVDLLPVSPLDKLRDDQEEPSIGAPDQSAPVHESSHSEYNSLVQQVDDHQNKMVLGSAKTHKTPVPQQPNVDAVDSNPRTEDSSQNSSTVRSSLTSLDIHINVPFGNHTPSVSYRANEGPFLSSLTLWGLAMKTLQNDNDLDQ